MTSELEALEAGLPEALSRPEAYPNDPDAREGVDVVQTHLSHVFLTRNRVYKLHKDVDLGFVSFTTQRARNEDGLRELHLNRRLAPDVYLGLAPVERVGGSFQVVATVADPTTVGVGEHCVVMRRLPEGRDARSLLEAGALGRPALRRLATQLARFHRDHSLGRPSPFSPDEWLLRIAHPVEANFESLLGHTPMVVPEKDVSRLRDLTQQAFERLGLYFERRRENGRATDAHGDLHLDHVWFESDDADPIVIDCIAFDEGLRRIDAAADLAFLTMDLGNRGHRDLAELLLATYAAVADDYDLYHVIDFYMSYRAAVRAKVAALESVDPGVPEAQRGEARQRAQRRIDFALDVLAPRSPGSVHLVGGIIGTGKSTVARALAEETGAAVISSDAVRLRMDDEETRPAGWQEGRYSLKSTERVYAAMLERAEAVVASGRDVVLDASWSRRDRRERARAAARAWGATTAFVEVCCPREITLARLEERQRRGDDASEAGPEIYDDFAAAFEAPDEWPEAARFLVDSSQPDWRERLGTTLRLR